MKLLANAFVIAFLGDGILSLLDDLLIVGAGTHLLSSPRALLSGLVLLGSLPVYILLGATPRLPWRVFLPPCLFLTWLGMGAMPLPVWLGLQGALLVTSALKIGLGVATLVLVRRVTGGVGWLFTEESLAGPRFRWRTALGFSAVNVFLILPATLAYLFLAASSGIDSVSGGFLRMDTSGLYTTDRAYTRGEQTVHLIGMMHIGESSYYSELIESFPTEGAVILREGVSDEQNLLPDGISYEPLAASLGLESQGPLGGDEHAVVDADVDISTFSPETLSILRHIGELLASESAFEALVAYSRLVETRPDLDTLERLQHDLLEMRNEHLFAQVTASLEEYDHVIVPWGALHMAGIESMLLELGFAPGPSREWRILSW